MVEELLSEEAVEQVESLLTQSLLQVQLIFKLVQAVQVDHLLFHQVP